MELVCAVVPIKEINLVLKTPVLFRGGELDRRIYLSAGQNSPGDICSWWASLDVHFPVPGEICCDFGTGISLSSFMLLLLLVF